MTTTAHAGWTFSRSLIVMGGVAAFVGASLMVGFNYAMFLEEPPFLVLAGLGWAGALLVALMPPRPWTYLAGGIAVALFPLMVIAAFGVFVLMMPVPSGSWGGVLFLALALGLALPAGIRGFVRARKGRAMASVREGFASRGGLTVVAAIGLVVGAAFANAAAGAALADLNVASTGFDFAPEATVAISQEEFAFHPAALTVPAGKVTEVRVTNADPDYHDFTYTYAGRTFTHPVLPGSTTTFLVKFDEAGEIPFRCSPHSGGYDDDPTESMTGKMTVA